MSAYSDLHKPVAEESGLQAVLQRSIVKHFMP